MKTRITLILGGALFLAMPAFAGIGAGNGGGAFICPDPTKSEFLDLFEAGQPSPEGLGLTIPLSNDPIETQIQGAFKRLNPATALYRRVEATYAQVKAARQIPVPAGFELAWPSDEHNKYAPAGCYQKGIMLFHDSDNSVDIDTTSLSDLPPTQQAAAWVHETIYKFFRETQNAQNSITARKVVGFLFSDLTDDQVASALESYGLRPRTGASHVSDDQTFKGVLAYYVSYAGEPTPPIQYQITFEQNSSRDRRCKTPEQLHVITSGSLQSEIDPETRSAVYSPEAIKNYSKLFNQGPALFWGDSYPGYRCPFSIQFHDSQQNLATLQLTGFDDEFYEYMGKMLVYPVPDQNGRMGGNGTAAPPVTQSNGPNNGDDPLGACRFGIPISCVDGLTQKQCNAYANSLFFPNVYCE